jgi:hypothetical protein
MAVSKDGGTTFQNFKVSESPFIPSAGTFFGDYTNVTAHNNVVRPIWTRLSNGDLSVWTALVKPEALLVNTTQPDGAAAAFSIEALYPNPSLDLTAFSFKLRHRSLVNLYLVDLQGKVRTQLIDNEWRDMGKYVESIDQDQLGLSAGAYFVVLSVDGVIARRKVMFLGNE